MNSHIILEKWNGLDRLRLINKQIMVDLLPEKGCNILQIQNTQGQKILAQTHDISNQIERYLINGKKSSHYSDHYEGGWQDVFPSRYGIAQKEIDLEGSGEGCTLPWNWIISSENNSVNGWKLLLTAFVELPVSGFHIKKRFYLGDNHPNFRLETEIFNSTNHNLNFTWNQHPAFGSDLLRGLWSATVPKGNLLPFPFLHHKDELQRLYQIPLHDFRVPITQKSILDHFQPYDEKDLFYTVRNLEENVISIQNHTFNFKAEMRWDLETFPHLWYWTANREQIKTVAYEPSSTWLPQYLDSFNHQLTHSLAPQRKMSTWIEISIKNI